MEMSQQTGFSHIKVTPASEDEEVIVAGSATVDDCVASDNTPSATSTSASDASVHKTPLEDAHVQEVPSSKVSKKVDGYRETTMDDIKTSKMSGIQKGIVVVAILIIIAFVVYSVVA